MWIIIWRNFQYYSKWNLDWHEWICEFCGWRDWSRYRNLRLRENKHATKWRDRDLRSSIQSDGWSKFGVAHSFNKWSSLQWERCIVSQSSWKINWIKCSQREFLHAIDSNEIILIKNSSYKFNIHFDKKYYVRIRKIWITLVRWQ